MKLDLPAGVEIGNQAEQLSRRERYRQKSDRKQEDQHDADLHRVVPVRDGGGGWPLQGSAEEDRQRRLRYAVQVGFDALPENRAKKLVNKPIMKPLQEGRYRHPPPARAESWTTLPNWKSAPDITVLAQFM